MSENCRDILRCDPMDLRQAMSIHTRKITDSCRDKDCIEDLRVYLTKGSQSLLDSAAGARVRCAELLYTYIDVEPVAFDRNHYCIDVTFYYRVLADADGVIADICGAKVNHYSRYPGWSYSGSSALADEYIDVCKELYNRHVEKDMIHAGLECGIIKANVPGLDCISCGPIMKNLHSPEEALHIESFGKYAYAICTLIEKAK